MPLLTVVLPTYNEAENVAALVPALADALEGVDHEVLVVDDDSGDGTAAAAEGAGARVVVRRGERGLATAVVRGLAEARGTYVLVMDADFQHPPEVARRMLDRAVEADAELVVGSRYVQGGSEAAFPWHRRLVSRGARLISRVALVPVRRHRLTDPMSGLFLVRRDRVDLDALRPRGYKILLEVLCHRPFRRVAEVGYVFQDRRAGTSKLGLGVIVQYLWHVGLLAWRLPENRRVRRFALVGASGVVVNLGLLYALHGVLGVHDLVAVPLAVEASIVSNFLLNDRFTFRDRRRGHRLRRLAQFNAVSLFALLVNFAAYAVLTRLLGIHYLLAQFLAIVVAFAANYAGNLYWTYGAERRVVE